MKLWLGSTSHAPPGWTSVASVPEVIAILKKGGVTDLAVGDRDAEDEFDKGLDALSWLEEAVSNKGFKPPRIESHATLPTVAADIERSAWRIGYRTVYNERFPSQTQWEEFLKESERTEARAMKETQQKIPQDRMLEHALDHGDEAEHRPVAHFLLERLKLGLPGLRAELEDVVQARQPEEAMYRFYHQSWKCYDLQGTTLQILKMLQSVLPHQPLNPWFMQIVREGTGKEWERAHNDRWLQETRPILEAFFHARWFLEICAHCAETLPHPPRLMPTDWAGVLYLYNLR